MLQRLQIALAQAKPVNASENILNEISQTIYLPIDQKILL